MENWEEYLQSEVESTETVDDQPTEESEEEVEETEELTEHEVEPDSEEEETEEESDSESDSEEEEVSEEEESAPLSDETEIELGEDKQPVTLKELKDGYLRQSDYTKKTQKLADERKEVESLQEELKPVQEYKLKMEQNPWLFEQIEGLIQEYNNTGVLPIQEVLEEAKYSRYLNHLLAENKKLKSDLDKTQSDFESTKFDGEMRALEGDLKAEYGELADADYLDTLRQRAKDEGLSIAVLKEIAEGHLSKKQLEQEKANSRKAVAKAQQKQKSKRLPPQPKPKGQKPSKVDPLEIESDGWEDFFDKAVQ